MSPPPPPTAPPTPEELHLTVAAHDARIDALTPQQIEEIAKRELRALDDYRHSRRDRPAWRP